MNKETEAVRNDLIKLAEDARALMSVTSDIASEKVVEARRRLAATLDQGKEMYGRLRDKTVEGVQRADAIAHERPYQLAAIGLGVGVLVGAILARQRRSRRDQ
jgi:ElaB/YqjD/DUF883 family membrane-anchored ribosome-binding protein